MHGKNTDVSVLKCQLLLSPHGRIMGDLFIYFSYFHNENKLFMKDTT